MSNLMSDLLTRFRPRRETAPNSRLLRSQPLPRGLPHVCHWPVETSTHSHNPLPDRTARDIFSAKETRFMRIVPLTKKQQTTPVPTTNERE